MTPSNSNSIIRRIFRRVFLKKRKKQRGRRPRTNTVKRNDRIAVTSIATSNDTTDTTSFYPFNDANNLTPPFVMSPPNRSSTGQPRRDWRSGYKPIDDLIQEIRLEFPYPAHNLNWIPFDEFVGHKYVTRGGYSAIYEATWSKSGQTIALKCLEGSQDFSSDYLNEIKTHWCLFSQPQFLRCYGITQLPNGEFMMVMQYASFGDLRVHLQRNRISSWKDKIRILKQIARGLAEMHKRDLVHGDLHSGNVMNIDRSHFVIGDVGLCGPANRITRKKAVYGVLPYVAPELLRGAEYSKKADIYSFAIIMWEICSGIRPYAGTAHDVNMARDICEGKRPPVPPGTPSFYSELMKSCWDANPRNRPDAPEVLKTVYHWLVNDSLDEFLRKGGSTITFNNMSNNLTHPEANYHSRLLDFPELKDRKRQAQSLNISSRDDLRSSSVGPSSTQDNLTKSPQGALNNYSQSKFKLSQETIESKSTQNTNNNSKPSLRLSYYNTTNKSQDTLSSRSVPPKSPQRTNGYSKLSKQRIYNSSSPKLSQNSSSNSNYLKNQTPFDSKQSQRNPQVKSEDSISISSKPLELPLSVLIPDDDIATLTSFWSMDGNPNAKDKANTIASRI